MTYKELKDKITDLNAVYGMNFTVVNDGKRVIVKNDNVVFAKINNSIPYYIELKDAMLLCLDDNLRHDFLSIVYEFAQTPINSRNLNPRFYISSKLTPKVDEKFLFKFGGSINHLAWGVKDGGGTEFTQEEIDYICDKFHTNLSDFDIIEVEK